MTAHSHFPPTRAPNNVPMSLKRIPKPSEKARIAAEDQNKKQPQPNTGDGNAPARESKRARNVQNSGSLDYPGIHNRNPTSLSMPHKLRTLNQGLTWMS